MAFALQFDPALIPALAARFSFKDDSAALAAGRCIAAGEHTLAHLVAIVAWKSPRSVSKAEGNAEVDVADVLRLAVSARTELAAMSVLIGLKGVETSVASAVMAAVSPDRFTIIDRRALEALGTKKVLPPVDYYLSYLEACRGISTKNGCSLRTLDKALWQWSKEHTV